MEALSSAARMAPYNQNHPYPGWWSRCLHTTGNKTTHHYHVWFFCKRRLIRLVVSLKSTMCLPCWFNGLDQITGIQMTSIQKFGDEIG
jgi:hypothetical protein